MAKSVQQPLVGQLARYEGVYRPHWEIGHIAVRASRVRRLVLVTLGASGLLVGFWLCFLNLITLSVFAVVVVLLRVAPAEERWAPIFPPDFAASVDGEGGPIVFEGIVSAPGWYGHKGIMRRRVEIVRVLCYQPHHARRCN